jgi:hypothetical protein
MYTNCSMTFDRVLYLCCLLSYGVLCTCRGKKSLKESVVHLLD